jgi:impB/mucB/samB family C-terminal domain
MRDFRSISLGAYNAINATINSRVFADPHPLDEMQQKLGEDSIWVYEIIRYTYVSVIIGETTEYSTEGSISQKVCSTRTFSSPPQRIELPCLVKEKPTLTKSMMASKNLPHPITKSSEGPHWLRVLAAELALRLNELRATDISVWPKTIVLHARHRMVLISISFRAYDRTK